jgi:flagellar protein FliO/FliZ
VRTIPRESTRMSSTAKTLASDLGRFIAALLLLLLAPCAFQSDIAWAQASRNGTPAYPPGSGNEAPSAPQRFAPDANATRPLAQPAGYPPVEGQRTTHTTPDTQARPNSAATTPPPKARQPILLSPRGKGTTPRGSNAESGGAEERRQGSSAKPNLLAIFGSLGIVLGLFFLVAWVMRRGMPASAKLLPSEVVEVLGRTPLAGRQHAHLIRCGNKMLLVALTADSAKTLTEITDPLEVDRIAGLCREAHPHSSSQAFRQILQQFAREKPSGGWFGGLTGSKPSKSVVSQDIEEEVEDLNV